ncbi:hypothetical protein HQQ80_16935 [Microbacteriaceae bacterium VKM Ac-2855]|nr:hypothetical protein [Microbacteriaceae bacterium VKM Ac-2855]
MSHEPEPDDPRHTPDGVIQELLAALEDPGAMNSAHAAHVRDELRALLEASGAEQPGSPHPDDDEDAGPDVDGSG